MHSVLWTLAQSMAPGLAASASPGTSQNVSPAADLLNLNLHLNKIPGKSTCSLQFEKHQLHSLVQGYPSTYSLSSITPSQMKIQFLVYIMAAFYSVASDRKGAFPIRLYYLRKCILSKATPWTVACQAPLPMEFSRQEYYSGMPSPVSKANLEKIPALPYSL